MHEITDDLLLATAQIAATLIGLLLLGAFFYVETGLRRAAAVAPQGAPFLRATTKLTLLLYTLVLGISLGVVMLRPAWFAVVFIVLSVAAIRVLLEWTRRYHDLRAVMPIPRESPWLVWPIVLLTVALPWVLDGWAPGRQALSWSLLFAGVLALAMTVGLVLTSFDLAAWEKLTGSSTEPGSTDA
ncbi:hypothetical protein [Phytoactinopolyspora mesophila]|uniref:Uncharacterized protein n=1 Tax=Phytoactinopolyspora mesophila TaxID=2650750 RepID=A0A7K3M2B5_9ACTN|nr:hypothetical protein [Phytoactinopolyspora mesophila]NDL57177.1 hypothetical protein [Phytoactinopolyspora mesophila]